MVRGRRQGRVVLKVVAEGVVLGGHSPAGRSLFAIFRLQSKLFLEKRGVEGSQVGMS